MDESSCEGLLGGVRMAFRRAAVWVCIYRRSQDTDYTHDQKKTG